MSYLDIFILGWNLNALMFALNFIIVLFVVNSYNKEDLKEQSKVLNELKKEFDQYYPYRKYSTLGTYLFPFAAFFRMSYRLLEMKLFLSRNTNSTMYDYMMYKYENDILVAKNK